MNSVLEIDKVYNKIKQTEEYCEHYYRFLIECMEMMVYDLK